MFQATRNRYEITVGSDKQRNIAKELTVAFPLLADTHIGQQHQ